MSTMFKSPFVLVLSTVFAAGAAQAGVVDLGIGGANFYSLSNFTASGSDVEGGVLVAGNLSASSYSINDKNKDAYVSHGNTGYALVVGGNLNYSSGSIKNGNYYVGGTTTTSSVGLNTASKTTVSPVSFASTSAQL
ncbi:MAG: choice-of-anchor A family protein, partial [Janthinobacterium sp.]